MLSSLPKIVEKKKKRLGRGLGTGKGAKSGRGTTRHQKAREDIPLHFEGGNTRFIKKFPLIRGKGRNKPLSDSAKIITMNQLNAFDEGTVVNVQSLIEKKFISERDAEKQIKILANGSLTKKLTVELPVSRAAQEMIEKAGGQVVTS